MKDLYFATALRIARRAVIGALEDMTHGAKRIIMRTTIAPLGEGGESRALLIGRHVFYRLV
ncbi:MAG: hypothetical protein R3D66_04985 [Alphaproteobacteria bacterium]